MTENEEPRTTLAGFLWANKWFWLLPILLVFALVLALLLLPHPDVVPPFVYG